jgi:hypothetical protein
MEKEFIPYAEALALKELGFDQPCFGYYKYEELLIQGQSKNSDHGFSISAPLYQQVFRWFREKYNLWGMIYPRDGWNYSIQRVDETTSCTGESFHGVEIKSYEEAELECLKKLIEIVKEKK